MYLVAQLVGVLRQEVCGMDWSKHVDQHRAGAATEPPGVIPKDFPRVVNHHRYNRHVGFDGQLERAILEIVQVWREFFADMPFGEDGHAPAITEVGVRLFERFEGRYLTLPVQRNIDCTEK